MFSLLVSVALHGAASCALSSDDVRPLWQTNVVANETQHLSRDGKRLALRTTGSALSLAVYAPAVADVPVEVIVSDTGDGIATIATHPQRPALLVGDSLDGSKIVRIDRVGIHLANGEAVEPATSLDVPSDPNLTVLTLPLEGGNCVSDGRYVVRLAGT